jgi:thymidylate synthase (FAD)
MFTTPTVELLDTFGSDLTVVNAARVSLGKQVSEFTEKDAKLIKYLADHDHISPFFHPQAQFRLKMPIWMAREWFRHTVGFARNEVSRRYVDSEPEFYIPAEIRTRAPSKKQGSNDDVHADNDRIVAAMRTRCKVAAEQYDTMLKEGVCPEQARMILPQCMMTEFIETASLAAYARLVKLRTTPDAQKEICEVAEDVATLLQDAFPYSWPVLFRS